MADPLHQSTAPPQPAWVRLCQWLWNQQGFLWGTVILGIALNLFASWLVTPSGSIFSQTPLGTLLGYPLPFALGGLGMLGLTGGLWLINRRYPAPASQKGSTSSMTLQNRQVVIRLLQQDYNKRLARALDGASKMTLRLHEHSDITRSSAQLVFRHTATAEEQPLPPDTTITQVYDDTGQGGLLLLGEPGTGKTIELLNLALELLRRAESNPDLPIPVILNLSSWASKKLRLVTWVIDQLLLVYRIPPFLSQTWLEQGQWLLLLDGLDEVGEPAYVSCIHAINAYQDRYFAPLVVCSRSHEYLTHKAWLALSSAVIIQPLEEQQVMEYLKQAGKPLAAVRAALHSNDVLRELMVTPLMLSMVISAYRGKTVGEISLLGSPEEQQEQIFQQYAKRMLEMKAASGHTLPQQAQYWLAWLARRMSQHHSTEFYLERLQPTWLATERQQNSYISLARLNTGLCNLLIWGLGSSLFVGVDFWLQAKSIAGLPLGIIAGFIVYGLPIGQYHLDKRNSCSERSRIVLQS